MGGHNRHRQPGAVRVHQRHTLAPQHLFGSFKAARPTHRNALDRLRVDHGQAWLRFAAPRSSAQLGHMAQQRIEQALFLPAPEPAIGRAPRHQTSRQRSPCPAHPQVPSQRAHNGRIGRRLPAARRVRALQPLRRLANGAKRHHALQAGLVPRPMRLGPHLSLTPPRQAVHGGHQGIRQGSGAKAQTQTGSKAGAGQRSR